MFTTLTFLKEDVHATEHVCRSEGNLRELTFSFHHVDTMDSTKVIRLSDKTVYTLSHLAGLMPLYYLFIFKIRFIHFLCGCFT